MDESTQERILELLDDNKSASDIVKILKKEDKVTVSKATVNRCRKLITALGDDKKLTPEQREIYLSYMEKQNNKPIEDEKHWYTYFIPINRTAVDGPLDPNMPEVSMTGHQNFLNTYVPQNMVQPIEVDISKDNKILSQPKPFTAKISNSGIPAYPKFFWNPYTALDLLVFQDVYTHTICGTIIDILVAFAVGLGIKPVLKLVSEKGIVLKEKKQPKKEKPQQQDPTQSKDPNAEFDTSKKPEKIMETKQEAIERLLDENKDLLDPLIAIDNSFGERSRDAGISEDWNTLVEAFVRNHWIFGRDMITMETSDKYVFEYEGVKYPNIRTIAKVQHPRDLNFIQIDQETQNVVAVSLMFSPNMVSYKEMIYLAHMTDSPIYNAKHYGYALIQRMLGDGRSLRKIKDRDFPNIASVGYAPFTIVAMKRDEKGTKNENKQNQVFLNTMVSGQPNAVSLNNPEKDLVVHSIDLKPDIPGLIQLAHYHAEAAAKSAQVPTTLVSQEKDPNRDTLLGILRIFSEVEIPRKRLPITRAFTKQHYMVNFDEIYKDKKEVLKTFRVEAEFTDVKIDSWVDKIGAFIELNKVFRFTADASGEMLGIQNLESKIDTEKEPLGESNSMTDNNGNKLTMSKSPKSPDVKKST